MSQAEKIKESQNKERKKVNYAAPPPVRKTG